MAIKSDLSLLRSVPALLVVDFFHFIGFGADMGNFVPIDELGPYVNSNELVDVIGVVQNVSPTMSIRRKINNETIPKRDITIADETKKTVVVSLWNDLATNIGQELLDISDKSLVVAIKALKVGDFQGVSLSALSKSIVVVNPDTPESKKLRSWYDSEGKEVSMASIGSGMSSTTNTGTRSMYIDRVTLSYVNQNQSLGEDKNGDVANFSIYIHSRPGFVFNEKTRSAFFHDRQVRNSIQVTWGEPTMIEVEWLLLEAALEEPANQRFVLLSDSGLH